MLRKKYIILTIIALATISLSLIAYFTLTNQKRPLVEYWESKRPQITNIETFGEENQFVLIQLSKGDLFPNGGLGHRYLVTDGRRYDTSSSSEKPSKGWFWNLYIYDIEAKKPKAQKVDLYALVKRYDPSYYLNALGSVVYQDGQDYQILELHKWKGDSPKFVLLNLETHKIEDENPVLKDLKSRLQYRLGDLAAGTNFRDNLSNNGGWLRNDFLTSYSENQFSNSITLSQEYPAIIEKMKVYSGNCIGFRQGLVSGEDQYQTLRHWFAPIGQDKLEVLGSKTYNGETTVLNTFEEFQEWRSWRKPNHSEN